MLQRRSSVRSFPACKKRPIKADLFPERCLKILLLKSRFRDFIPLEIFFHIFSVYLSVSFSDYLFVFFYDYLYVSFYDYISVAFYDYLCVAFYDSLSSSSYDSLSASLFLRFSICLFLSNLSFLSVLMQ